MKNKLIRISLENPFGELQKYGELFTYYSDYPVFSEIVINDCLFLIPIVNISILDIDKLFLGYLVSGSVKSNEQKIIEIDVTNKIIKVGDTNDFKF